MKDELLDLAKQARERKIVYSDNNEKDIAVCHELEIIARVAEKKSLNINDELTRVRGLLQRIGQAARDDRNGDRIEKILELIEQGAESADIGKLDTADDKLSAITGKLIARNAMLVEVVAALNLPPETLEIASCNHVAHVAQQARENAALYFQKWAEAQSTFRPSPSPTGSGLREPAKLNNAQFNKEKK